MYKTAKPYHRYTNAAMVLCKRTSQAGSQCLRWAAGAWRRHHGAAPFGKSTKARTLISCVDLLYKRTCRAMFMHTHVTVRVSRHHQSTSQLIEARNEATETWHSGWRWERAHQAVMAVGADAVHCETLRKRRRWRMGGAPAGPGSNLGAINQHISLMINDARFVAMPTSICNVQTLRVFRRRRFPQGATQRNEVTQRGLPT